MAVPARPEGEEHPIPGSGSLMIYPVYINMNSSSATPDISLFVRCLSQRTDGAKASVLWVDDIHRSHLIAGHRRVQAQLGLTGATEVLDAGINPVHSSMIPKVIR